MTPPARAEARARRAPVRRRRAAPVLVPEGSVELLHFSVGKLLFAVARTAVRAIRPSPRLRSVLGGPQASAGLPLVSLSTVLGLERDASVDRRVIEVVHWGQRLGLEVTAIVGMHHVPPSDFHPLPAWLKQTLRSRAVLGIVRWRPDGTTPGAGAHERLLVALELSVLLTERGVEVPTDT